MFHFFGAGFSVLGLGCFPYGLEATGQPWAGRGHLYISGTSEHAKFKPVDALSGGWCQGASLPFVSRPWLSVPDV